MRAREMEPSLYQINLSRAPEDRYTHICRDFQPELGQLIAIYDDLLELTPFPRLFGFLAKRFLRRLYSDEETREIRGISTCTRVPLHLIVAYNTFLDLFSGCMSGGVQAKIPRVRGTRMLHFRNLDWAMDLLRDLVIRVEYVVSGKVIARAVTYAGYIGVLTGVREGLSMSLNYRARIHSASSAFANRAHHLFVLLGFQPSIASHLRHILLSSNPPPTLHSLAEKFTKEKASSCYLTFCTPAGVLIIEKDLSSAVTHFSDTFLAVTNHDESMEKWETDKWKRYVDAELGSGMSGGIKEIMEESIDRKACICELWKNKGRRKATVDDIKTWLQTYPVRNECTHYSCIMDPSVEGGGLLWVEACEEDTGREDMEDVDSLPISSSSLESI